MKLEERRRERIRGEEKNERPKRGRQKKLNMSSSKDKCLSVEMKIHETQERREESALRRNTGRGKNLNEVKKQVKDKKKKRCEEGKH